MRKAPKRLLEWQINVFLEWTRRVNLAGRYYGDHLAEFLMFTDKEDVMDVNEEEFEKWVTHLASRYSSELDRQEAKKALEALMRFYRARGVNALKKESRGRPMDINGREQVRKYRNKGLTLREIQKLTGKNISLIHRWIRESVDSLKGD